MSLDAILGLIGSLFGGVFVAILTFLLYKKKFDVEIRKTNTEIEKTALEIDKLKLEIQKSHQEFVSAEHYNPIRYQEFLLFIIHSQLQKGDVEDIVRWFQEYKEEWLFAMPKVLLAYGVLSRLAGHPSASQLLKRFTPDMPFSRIAQYELTLLRFSKPDTAESLETLSKFVNDTESRNLRKLWASLAAIISLREQQLEKMRYYFEFAKQSASPYYEAYASLQIGIVAAAIGEQHLTEKYLNIARQILPNHYPVQDYPYVLLLSKHNKAFVHTLIGVDSYLSKEDIQNLKGYAHLLAQYSRIFRNSDTAIQTIEKISSGWRNPVRGESVVKRLANFEDLLLAKAGTLFVD